MKKILCLIEVECPKSGQNTKQFTSDQVFRKEIVFYETNLDRYGRPIAKSIL